MLHLITKFIMPGLRSRHAATGSEGDAIARERRTRRARRRPAWEARKTVLQNRLEELLVFEITLTGHREYRTLVRRRVLLNQVYVRCYACKRDREGGTLCQRPILICVSSSI
jgi:hypothetical protein